MWRLGNRWPWMLAILAGLIAGMVGWGERQPAPWISNKKDLLRLHIVAASDDPRDQAVKLRVRDAVLQRFGEIWANAGTERHLEALILRDWNQLTRVAQEAVWASGAQDIVSMELGEFDFPARTYEGRLVPAGRYRGLRIVIGPGAGHNWWCILFPPLCLDGRSQAVSEQDQGTAAAASAARGAPTAQATQRTKFAWGIRRAESLSRWQVARRLRQLWESSVGWIWPKAVASAQRPTPSPGSMPYRAPLP